MTWSRPPRAPRPRPGRSRSERSRPADPDLAERLGLPPELPPDWHERAIARLGAEVAARPSLRRSLDTCMRCGACTDKCHFFLGTGDARNMPVARQELLRSVYRRHYTWLGRHLPWLVGARDLDREMLESWYVYFHQCTQCRRCAVFCPVGVDTAEFAMAARAVLAEVGMGQHYTLAVIANALEQGNNLGLPLPALRHTLSELEAELEEATGRRIRLPLDEPDAEVLIVVPSADFFGEPHVSGLLGMARMLHAAGVSWTLSSSASEASSYPYFIGDREGMETLARRIRDAARALGARRLVFGECGHAWQVAGSHLESLAGPLDFLAPGHRRPEHLVELSTELLDRGAVRLDPDIHAGKRVTYHDSCNIARGPDIGRSPRGRFELPRRLLRAACPHFVEMPRWSIRERTLCCGAGGGLLTEELAELRRAGASPRMAAFRETVERFGVTHLAAMCAICKAQLTRALVEEGLSGDAVVGVHQLVGEAVVLS